MKEVLESCDNGFISFDKLGDIDMKKYSLINALRIIKEFLITPYSSNSNEELKLKIFSKIKSNPDIIKKSFSSFSTLTN
jgi:hypothetical protein